jgi:hypothetical protein
VGPTGIEPVSFDPQSKVLPLNYGPINLITLYCLNLGCYAGIEPGTLPVSQTGVRTTTLITPSKTLHLLLILEPLERIELSSQV